ncbi:uncharacterized protein MYCFIDRAFT_78355 [Pseudocercospora fijiensis CIRAD86]|uniref:F-box domain-containing protein n=1 Tax=Pseudocercospora fijiensis (strain CIRAD86) TaxID=383855 RepID=M2ZHP7_PSEFD|nr:uncharacterized protein MYCFIDRAFT_78355 [Pseudocercospora fijiensis CIRAD86]EME78644.1 hypothetical protein MYCFIDRAFT_78355 [Pseudocercospora fijiensis CIRAD86]
MILLGVDDLQALLLAQRVNRMFQATIATSKHLQEKLWFEAKDDEGTKPNELGHARRQIHVIDDYYGHHPNAPPLPPAPPNTTFSSLFKKPIDVSKGRFLQFVDRGKGHCRDHTIVLHRNAFSCDEMSRTWRSMLFKGFGNHDGLIRLTLLPEDEDHTARISHAEGTLQRLIDDLRLAVAKMQHFLLLMRQSCKAHLSKYKFPMPAPSLISFLHQRKHHLKSRHFTAMALAQDENESPRVAAAKVFGIAELAEMILLGVDDAPTLAHARRVNKMFKEIFDRNLKSPYLQEKLWFKREENTSTFNEVDSNSENESSEGEDLEEHGSLLGPEDIELNPWVARGCIAGLSLQYMKDSAEMDICCLEDTPVVVMTVHKRLGQTWNEYKWWDKMEVCRARSKARKGQTFAYITKFRGESHIVGDVELWWAQDRNLKEMVSEAVWGLQDAAV